MIYAANHALRKVIHSLFTSDALRIYAELKRVPECIICSIGRLVHFLSFRKINSIMTRWLNWIWSSWRTWKMTCRGSYITHVSHVFKFLLPYLGYLEAAFLSLFVSKVLIVFGLMSVRDVCLISPAEVYCRMFETNLVSSTYTSD